MDQHEQMKHDLVTTQGLWAIDKDPRDVSYEWIVKNAFKIEHKCLDTDCIEATKGPDK